MGSQRRGYVSINFALFGIFIGAALTLFITIHSLPSNDSMLPWFWSAGIFSSVLTLFFLVMSIIEYIKANNVVKKIRKTELEGEVEFAVTDKINQIKPRAQS
jgi:uncharacterized membrane protein YjfL (UPF0719 family)